jgi:hypothetical protein
MWFRGIVTKVLINPIILTRTRHLLRAYHPTRDNILFLIIKLILIQTQIAINWSFCEKRSKIETNGGRKVPSASYRLVNTFSNTRKIIQTIRRLCILFLRSRREDQCVQDKCNCREPIPKVLWPSISTPGILGFPSFFKSELKPLPSSKLLLRASHAVLPA